jgi:hypothetical protein
MMGSLAMPMNQVVVGKTKIGTIGSLSLTTVDKNIRMGLFFLQLPINALTTALALRQSS